MILKQLDSKVVLHPLINLWLFLHFSQNTLTHWYQKLCRFYIIRARDPITTLKFQWLILCDKKWGGIVARWYLTSGHKKKNEPPGLSHCNSSGSLGWIHCLQKMHYFCHQCVIFWEKKCKNSHKFIRGCSTTLNWAFYRVSMDYGKRRNFTQKIEGVPIRRSCPVPLKVVWMRFKPLINVLKGLISNHSNHEGWVANDGKFIPNVNHNRRW